MSKEAELKAEVTELLNQIAIKLKDVKKFEMESDYDYGGPQMGGPEEIYDEETEEYKDNPNRGTNEERWLYTTSELVRMVISSSDPSHILEQYYNSNC